MALIALHTKPVHGHYLKSAEIALRKALAHDLSLDLTSTFVNLHNVLCCAIIYFKVLGSLFNSKSLVLYRSDQLGTFVKFDRDITPLSSEEFLLQNGDPF